MKTIKFIPKKKYILAFMISGLFYFSSYAQDISDRLHFNVYWQMNAPLNTNFADKISGWGMNLEVGYFLTPHWSLGAFLDFHTNHKYVPRQTITEGTASLTTDRQESAFQLPFGLAASYRFISNGCLKPYVGTKIGTMYAQNTTYLNTISPVSYTHLSIQDNIATNNKRLNNPIFTLNPSNLIKHSYLPDIGTQSSLNL